MKRRVLSLLLCAATALSLFACTVESPEESNAQVETPSQEVQSESPTPEPTEEPSLLSTPEPEATPAESQLISLDALCIAIEMAVKDNFSGCSVTHDDNMITVSIWADGVAMEIASGDGSRPDEWDDLRAGMISFSDSLNNLIDSLGRDDVPSLLNVLNDLNHDNVLLSVLDGVVIYDVMDEAPDPAPTQAPAETATTGQRNALSKAKQYLSIMAFSHSGLVDQLEYEGYTTEEATYGADNCGADWTEQALKKALQYIDIMPFSKQGLTDQLKYDGFTAEEAAYGADNCQADWNEQAAKKAQDYTEILSFSRQRLIDQLKHDGFTQSQAEYGVTAIGY